MKPDQDLESVMGAVPPMSEPSGDQRGLTRLRRMLMEMRIHTLLRLYRFASLALSSVLFLWFPGPYHLYTQLGMIFLVLSTAILLIFLYEHFWENTKITTVLVLMEILAISLLLAFTGGFSGPFLWYALNPFIVSSAFFSFSLAWVVLGMLFAGTFVFERYFYFADMTRAEILTSGYHPILNLIVIAVVIHMYARMHMMMSERLMERSSQQRELMSAQENLSANYQVFKGLSNFQREAVSYNNPKDIYYILVNTVLNIFPFRQAGVLIPPADFYPGSGYRGNDNEEQPLQFQVIGPGKEKTASAVAMIQDELESRWDELAKAGAKRPVISKNRRWIALPLRGEDKKITAVFAGWLKPRINPLSFAENLYLFVRFTEQTTEWLSMFKQKERVLQHISAVYEAVETVSSQNDPRVVIDLFASYARALTDSDKTIFWMLNSGDGQSDEYYPIYSVKGPRDVFPEADWQASLLRIWSDLQSNQQPVSVEINSNLEDKAQLISVPVKTGAHCFGMLACLRSNNTFSTDEIIQILSVLADLSAIAVVRTRAEMFAQKLLVVDEQKRIANEIHDTISQNLFSIVYSIDALSRETGQILNGFHQETLRDIKNLSAETARELRALIYRLNPREEANEAFVSEITGYLEKMARMNAVDIKHTVNGSAEYLNPAICRNLYRIIKEATGNALRHGKCSELLVQLDITPFQTILKVCDNGNGFDMQSSLDLYTSGNRLGIVNMRELALSLQGNLNIDSKPGRGTEVSCMIPTSPVSVE